MKTKPCLGNSFTALIVALSLSLCCAFGQSVTNIPLSSLTNIFLNVEDFRFAVYGMKVAEIDIEKLKQARESDECKPESQDPKGHWGKAVEGFRLSLRFAKTSYTNGEPIEAIVLVRNISQRTLAYLFYEPEWNLHFLVSNSQNHQLQDVHPVEPWGLGSKELIVFPGTQRRFVVRIDGHFKFDSPGDYSVKVQAKVPRLDGDGGAEAISAAAILKIERPH